MKERVAVIVCGLALACVVPASAGIGSTPTKPRVGAQSTFPTAPPGYQKLQVWVGDWTYEGESKPGLSGGGGKVAGKVAVRPILGGRFVEWRGQEEQGDEGTVEWFQVDAYNPVAKRFTWNSYDSEGGVQTITYTLEGLRMSFAGTRIAGEKQERVRGNVVFTDNFTRFVEKTEVSADGKTWVAAFEGRFTKVKPKVGGGQI